ncbi:MAG: diguanylate cyclase [Actinobacteria bacterium]|nr:diguanylate cyclase [Actinomycetota bacterium]
MSRGKILLADDNKLVVKVTSAILESADYEVIVAWDGMEAINKAYIEQPDLVILDIEMPKINGYQVCRLLKDDELTCEIPIIMLTGKDHKADMFWGMKTGADRYITKGFKPEQLLSAISEQFEKINEEERETKKSDIPAKMIKEEGVLSRTIDLLDSKLFASTLLNELSGLLSSQEDYRETIWSAMEVLSHVIESTLEIVVLFSEGEMVVRVNGKINRAALENIKSEVLELADSYGLEPETHRKISVTVQGEDRIIEDGEGEEPDGFSTVHIPMLSRRAVIGVLAVSNPRSSVFIREAESILKMVQNQVTIVIDNARLYEAARQLAITDGLTRIYNHRFFQELFEKEFKRANRYNTIFSFIMLDIDRFKRINDTYGHLCGDEILKDLARLIKHCLRSVDIVARYGGEEFAILLPETNAPEAFQTAERIRRAVEEFVFMGNGNTEKGLKITVSQGVTTYPSGGVDDRFDVIAKADEAMYRAKDAGRNKVMAAE